MSAGTTRSLQFALVASLALAPGIAGAATPFHWAVVADQAYQAQQRFDYLNRPFDDLRHNRSDELAAFRQLKNLNKLTGGAPLRFFARSAKPIARTSAHFDPKRRTGSGFLGHQFGRADGRTPAFDRLFTPGSGPGGNVSFGGLREGGTPFSLGL